MHKNNRKFTQVMAFLILIQIIPMFANGIVFGLTLGTPYYDGSYISTVVSNWTQYKIDHFIPTMTAQFSSGNKFAFNVEIWEEKNIIVYGDYSSVPTAINDYKNATGDLDIDGKYIETPNKGYYGGGTGEYRYHGYDANNNPYVNGDFPVDANSGMKATAKNWIYRVWDITSPYYSNKSIKDASQYNKVAMGQGQYPVVIKNNIIKWINEGIPFEISNSTNNDKSGYNYAHVLTPPTTLMAGEMQMYHLSKYDGKPWYQVFSLNKIKTKDITPVEADVMVIDRKDVLTNGKVDKQFTVKVSGKLLDEAFYKDSVLKTTKYTRDDISSWSMTLTDSFTKQKQTLVGKRNSAEKGDATFTVVIPYAVYEPFLASSVTSIEPIFNATATSFFQTGEKSTGLDSTTERIDAQIIEEVKPVSIHIVAPHEMLDTEKFKISDTTTGEDFVRTVTFEGNTLNASEADAFLSGYYLFPLIGEDKVYVYKVTYDDNVKNTHFEYINYVIVYTTKPKAQINVTGTLKENRLITATSEIESINSSYLIANATITPNLFNATATSGNNGLIKFGTQNLSTLAFVVKGQEQIDVKIQAKATINPSKIERFDIPVGYNTSNTTTYTLYTLEDYAPALIANIWNGTLTRNESLDFYYDASSVDNDLISVNTYKIYFDQNGDDIPETLVKQGNYVDFTGYKPVSLGHYKVVFYAEESFGQPTLAQFITADEKRTFIIERDFYVGNLAPMTKLYTNIAYDFPQTDVIVLNDETIDRTLNNSIVSERVNWINGLRQIGIEASVQVWDLHTYVYSQSASTTLNTGNSGPPATTPYASGGYSGTLSRYNSVNNPYQVDYGTYITVTDSFTATDSRSTSGIGIQASFPPSLVAYTSGGYSGILFEDSYTYNSWPLDLDHNGTNETFGWSRTKTYSGVVSKPVQVWQSNYVWYNDYTGYYSGSIYKNVKQAFTPTFRLNSDKYLIYFADSNINNLVDIQAIKNKGTVKIILVANPSTKPQLSHDYFIDSSKSLATIMSEVNKIVANANPYENKQLLLIDETFTLLKADFDLESDPITDIGYEYVHDADYYDNPMGQEAGTVLTYSDNESAFTTDVKSRFSKVGHYSVYRKIKDMPVGNASYAKDSNIPRLDIYVHRKPIADFTLNWDYNAESATYDTTWVDMSYDLDHQLTDAQKGIRDRKIMYRKTSGDNLWIYAIPDNLTSGTYELRYIVKDIEGVWSDEITRTFTLMAEPPMRLEAKLKSTKSEFSTTSLPASESLTVYDIMSRYHVAHSLKMSLINSSNQTLQEKALLLSTNLPANLIEGNNYNWLDTPFVTGSAFPDGDYQIKLVGISLQAPNLSQTLYLPFKINTPISIVGEVADMTGGAPVTLRATTNKYAKMAAVMLFEGTVYSKNLSLIKSDVQPLEDSITWEVTTTVPPGVVEGDYTHLFTAWTDSGKSANDWVSNTLSSLTIESLTVQGYWNHWRGQTDQLGVKLANQPHRFLSYEKVLVTAVVKGSPDAVTLRLSPELEAMQYVNSIGQQYKYSDALGYVVTFPVQMVKRNENSGHPDLTLWTAEYILPLCKETQSFDDDRLSAPYWLKAEAQKGATLKSKTINDIEMTGNIYDLLYAQPTYK